MKRRKTEERSDKRKFNKQLNKFVYGYVKIRLAYEGDRFINVS